jgi:hypothetical protein
MVRPLENGWERMQDMKLLPSWIVDRLPINWWRPGNLHRVPGLQVHFCDDDHVRSIELNGNVVAKGRRLFPYGDLDSSVGEGGAVSDRYGAFPRSLTERERVVMQAMLTVSFPGVEELRAQLPALLVSGRCRCGCPTIDFSQPVELSGLRHVVNATVRGTNDGLVLFTSEGFLCSLEYAGTSDEHPDEFPAPDQLDVEPC